MKTLHEETIPARAGWSRILKRGEVLRLVDLVVDDTCGFHDTIGGGCSSALNRKRYDKPNDPSCRQNFLGELAKDGAMDMGPSISRPGDYIDLRAEMDVLAVVSNCPQINNPVNDFNPTAVRAIVHQPGA
jgi:uncharacterized protein YcgI (DUF1989 family)